MTNRKDGPTPGELRTFQRIIDRIDELGMSQAEVCRRARPEMNPSTFSTAKTRKYFSYEQVEALAPALRTTFADLVDPQIERPPVPAPVRAEAFNRIRQVVLWAEEEAKSWEANGSNGGHGDPEDPTSDLDRSVPTGSGGKGPPLDGRAKGA